VLSIIPALVAFINATVFATAVGGADGGVKSLAPEYNAVPFTNLKPEVNPGFVTVTVRSIPTYKNLLLVSIAPTPQLLILSLPLVQQRVFAPEREITI
jgi:hypothetical protein